MAKAEAAMANLADLSKLSKKLNAQSDEVNKILQDLEKKLVAMNLGISAWMPQSITLDSSQEIEGKLRFSLNHSRLRTIWQSHMLLVKKLRYCERRDENGEWDCEVEQNPCSIASGVTKIRIAALGQIKLIGVLEYESVRVIEAIEEGRKTVDLNGRAVPSGLFLTVSHRRLARFIQILTRQGYGRRVRVKCVVFYYIQCRSIHSSKITDSASQKILRFCIVSLSNVSPVLVIIGKSE